MPLCKVFRTLPVSSCDYTSGNSSGFEFHFSTRLRWTPGFVHRNLVESIGHEWKKINKPPLSIKPPPPHPIRGRKLISPSNKPPPSRVASCLGHFATEPVLGVQVVDCGVKS